MKKFFTIFIFALSFGAVAKNLPLDTVGYVDISRYLGKWYEIARFDQSFQKGCSSVTANYSLKKNNEIKVINSCTLLNKNGEVKTAEARAWVKDKSSNAKLKVQFFLRAIRLPFLAGNYWILDLGENYEYAIIGDPTRKYLWILSRTSKMEDSLYQELVAKAKDMHFDTSKLLKTIH